MTVFRSLSGTAGKLSQAIARGCRTSGYSTSWEETFPARVLQKLFSSSSEVHQAANQNEFESGESAKAEPSADRTTSGSQATTSQPRTQRQGGRSAGSRRPFGGDNASSDRLARSGFGKPQTTLEAKKAYRLEVEKKRKELRKKNAAAEEEAPVAAQSETVVGGTGLEAEEPVESETWIQIGNGKSFRDTFEEEDVGTYVDINRELLPEIFTRQEVTEEKMHPKGGCQGLEEELQATASDAVMLRAAICSLLDLIEAKERRHLYLTGPPSSGKSVALAAIVNRMRAQDWLVWYVPQALQLVQGGFFSQNDDGSYDTPEIARLLLHYLLVGNPERIAELQLPGGSSAKEAIEAVLAQTQPEGIVDVFLQVKESVCKANNVLIAIDNYPALYQPSAYGEWTSQHHRRVIDPSELRVAAAMRLLEQPHLENGVVLCAAQRGGQFSSKIRLPVAKEALYNLPSMDLSEWETLAMFYNEQEAVDEVDEATMRKCFYLTGANPKEFRLYSNVYGIDDAT